MGTSYMRNWCPVDKYSKKNQTTHVPAFKHEVCMKLNENMIYPLATYTLVLSYFFMITDTHNNYLYICI